MTLSLRWLQDYLQLPVSPEKLSDILTSLGLEVEKMYAWESVKGGLKGIVAGKVLTCIKHPNADKLSLTTVDTGDGTIKNIVCGASNIEAGQTVWVALPDTTLYTQTGDSFVIKVSKIRGEVSEGMICAEDEIGLGESHDGIMVLPDTISPGTKAAEYYAINEDILYEIGLTPNRADATSVLGVAEDIAAYLGVREETFYPVNWPPLPELKGHSDNSGFVIELEDQKRCPRYSGILLDNIVVGPSPAWIQSRLQSIGVKSINNVVDVTNFVLHEMGQPLHAFDADKIEGNKIIVKTLPEGTAFITLDGNEIKLSSEDLMICDGGEKPMCIGGVYGGLNSGVTANTKRIFLEAAYFDAVSIRRSSFKHNLRTEAAKRFEKGGDPELVIKALMRAADLLASVAGARVASSTFDLYPVKIEPARVKLDLQNVRNRTGVPFTSKEISLLLESLRMEFTQSGDDKWEVIIPTNKPDVTREVDVIEEILRVYGFDRIPAPDTMPATIAIESKFAPHRIRKLIGHHLAALGYVEAMNLSLTQPGYYEKTNFTDPSQWVTIHNTSNESLNLMRPDMVIPTLETVRRNVFRKQEDLRMFEFGKVYFQNDGMPGEKEYLVITLTGKPNNENWISGNPANADYFGVKAVVENLLNRLGITSGESVMIDNDPVFDFGMNLKLGDMAICSLGKIASTLTSSFDLKQDVYTALFPFEILVNLTARNQMIVKEVNKYPSVIRDLALVIEENVAFSKLEEIATSSGGNWLSDIEVFDVYRHDDHVGKNKKSVALRFTLDNTERPLTDKDIEDWFSGIQRSLVKETGGEIRR